MSANIIKLVACIAWACVGVSSATPASAVAATGASGAYAACSANSSVEPHTFCDTEFTYNQTIKFMQTACNSGPCNQEMSATYTEFLYGTGRKAATLLSSCAGEFGGQVLVGPNGFSFHGLDSCAC